MRLKAAAVVLFFVSCPIFGQPTIIPFVPNPGDISCLDKFRYALFANNTTGKFRVCENGVAHDMVTLLGSGGGVSTVTQTTPDSTAGTTTMKANDVDSYPKVEVNGSTSSQPGAMRVLSSTSMFKVDDSGIEMNWNSGSIVANASDGYVSVNAPAFVSNGPFVGGLNTSSSFALQSNPVEQFPSIKLDGSTQNSNGNPGGITLRAGNGDNGGVVLASAFDRSHVEIRDSSARMDSFRASVSLDVSGALDISWKDGASTLAGDVATGNLTFAGAPTTAFVTNTAIRYVPLASPPVTCDAAHEGWTYADTSHALCYCDSMSWTKLVTGSGTGTCT